MVRIFPGIPLSSKDFNVSNKGVNPPTVIKATLIEKEVHFDNSFSIVVSTFLPSKTLFDTNIFSIAFSFLPNCDNLRVLLYHYCLGYKKIPMHFRDYLDFFLSS